MNLLQTGNTVTIKVKNPEYPYRHVYSRSVKINEYHVYTGVIVNDKIVNFDEIGITGDSRMPVRRIKREDIVMVNESNVDYAAPVKNDKVCVTVQGSKGNTYVVTKENGKVSCSCPGYSYRKSCRHIDEVM